MNVYIHLITSEMSIDMGIANAVQVTHSKKMKMSVLVMEGLRGFRIVLGGWMLV